MSEVESILAERRTQHGPFRLHAAIAQTLKSQMQEQDNWEQLTHDQREALEMIQHKVARILAGDPNHVDHWIDICGYSQLVVNLLKERERERNG